MPNRTDPASTAERTPDAAEVPLDEATLRRLRRVVTVFVLLGGAFATVDLAYGILNAHVPSALMAFAILTLVTGLLFARGLLEGGRVTAAARVGAGAFLVVLVAAAAIRPFLYPVLAFGPVLVIGTFFPLLRGRSFLAATLMAACASGLIVSLGILLIQEPAFAVAQWYQAGLFLPALVLTAALGLFIFYHVGSQLTHSLHETRQSKAELEQLNTLKTQFMNNAAHELNTPLTPIRLQLHLLKHHAQGNLPRRDREAIDIVDRNVERMAALVHDILEASRIQGKGLALEPARFDLHEAVDETVGSFRDPAAAAGIRLEAELEGDLHLLADRQRVTQVLFNLVGNALKFTPSGGRVLIHAHRDGEAAEISVRDTGVGLEPGEAARLFRPFVQIDNRLQESRSGTGLGLYICKGIVEAHGGRIWVESPGRGHGATFIVRMPLRGRFAEGASWVRVYHGAPNEGEPDAEKGRRRPLEERIRDLI